jgi:serine/threonine protein kinase
VTQPTTLGRYKIIKLLGKGGMGSVYEAFDPNIARSVAIKTILVDDLSQKQADELQTRFLSEGRAAGLLQHDNIIRVFDADRDQGTAYLVMELVLGDDLDKHIKSQKSLSLARILSIMRDLLAALDHAHSKGIIHRDIKPANLLIDGTGRVKLGDFGVARITGNVDSHLTSLGSPIGTYRYMSPEQMLMEPIDTRADIWSAGVIFYQLLTGKHPFDGKNTTAIILAVQKDTPAPVSSLNPSLPSDLDAVVYKALAKKPEQRFASARDFMVALRGVNFATQGQIQSQGLPSVATSATDHTATSATKTSSLTQSTATAVSQEMELLYWKDIQNSTDPDDFKDYLLQFPSGVYAALASRRLKRLLPTPEEPTLGVSEVSDHTNKSFSSVDSSVAQRAKSELSAEPSDRSQRNSARLPAEAQGATEKALADRVAAQKTEANTAAAEKVAAARLASQKAAADKAEAEKRAAEGILAQRAAEKAAAERLAAERLAAEKVATEKAAADRLAAAQVAAQNAAAKAAADKLAAERLAAEKAAAEKAEADRLVAAQMAAKNAAAKAAADKLVAERLAVEKAAADKAEADRLAVAQLAAKNAAAKAAADRLAADRLAAEKTAADKAEADRLAAAQLAAKNAAAKAAADKLAAVRLAAEKTVADKAEADRLAAAQMAAKNAAAKAAADK